MTAAFNKALELYPHPTDLGQNPTPEATKARAKAILLRYSITSDEWPRMVRAFRTVMQKEIPSKPRALTPEEKQHHGMLLASELNEFNTAGTLVDQADGCLDIIYVALGALVNMGLSDTQILAGMCEVQASNMTKVQDNGTPLINDGNINPSEPIGKVLKTHNYIKANLAEAMSLAAIEEA